MSDLTIDDIPKASDIQIGGNHYKDFVISPAEFLQRNEVPFLESNVIKYILRHKKKNGLEDLEKAKHYIDLIIEIEYKDEKRGFKKL